MKTTITKAQYAKKVRFAYIETGAYLIAYIAIFLSWVSHNNLNEIFSSNFIISLMQTAGIFAFMLITLLIPAIILEEVYKIDAPHPYQAYLKAKRERPHFHF